MFKKIPFLLLVSLVVIACSRGQEATDTSATTPSATPVPAEKTDSDQPATAKKTRVLAEIHGIAALIEQPSEAKPFAFVMPRVDMKDAVHVAYVAWREDIQDGAPAGTVEDMTHPDGTRWRVHKLNREELVVGNDLSSNAAVTGPSDQPCAAPIGKNPAAEACIPRVAEFVNPPDGYNEAYVRRLKPSSRVAARMELGHGRVYGAVADKCEWEVATGSGQPKRMNFATRTIHEFELAGGEPLTLRLRNLDTDAVTDLVRLRANDLSEINFRVGNSVNVFPPPATGIKSNETDPHFHVYYEFLDGVRNGPSPKRTSKCHKGYDEVVYCGQGFIKRVNG